MSPASRRAWTPSRRSRRPDLRRPATAPRGRPGPWRPRLLVARPPRPRRPLLGRRRGDRVGHHRVAAAGRSGPGRLRSSGSPSSSARTAWRASRRPTACSCSIGERWWQRARTRVSWRRAASTRASTGRSASPNRRRWSRRGHDRPHRIPSTLADAPAPVIRRLASLLGQRRGSVALVGISVLAAAAGETRAAARHSQHRRSPSDRRPLLPACRRSRCSTCRGSRGCRR